MPSSEALHQWLFVVALLLLFFAALFTTKLLNGIIMLGTSDCYTVLLQYTLHCIHTVHIYCLYIMVLEYKSAFVPLNHCRSRLQEPAPARDRRILRDLSASQTRDLNERLHFRAHQTASCAPRARVLSATSSFERTRRFGVVFRNDNQETQLCIAIGTHRLRIDRFGWSVPVHYWRGASFGSGFD